jgi:hypothetical protein
MVKVMGAVVDGVNPGWAGNPLGTPSTAVTVPASRRMVVVTADLAGVRNDIPRVKITSCLATDGS